MRKPSARGATGYALSVGFALLATIVVGASGAAAAPPMVSGAERLHQLDMLLKVSEARCEKGGEEFRADYAAFAGRHRYVLDQADRELRTQLAHRYGAPGADRALQRMNVSLVREYGQGHPWLGCRDLKTITQGLALVQGSATLVEAADQILPGRASARFELVRE